MLKKYLYDLDSVPAQHKKFFTKLNAQITRAFEKFERGDKSLTRDETGGYVVVINNELVEIDYQNDEEGSAYEWIAREYNNAWYSDPMPTLKALKRSLGIQE